ncbi:MAG: AmmeMemoRadiSam system protein A [Patescibacteria group bacterium]
MHQYPELARKAIETYIRSGKTIKPSTDTAAELINRAAACFVSLHTEGDQLRGCIGTILPTQPSLAQEIIANAIQAATGDPRFAPLTEPELADLEISVDVLTEPEQISGNQDLDPKKYGVIVRAGSRSGLLLPDLDGVDTADQQVAIASQKGGIDLQRDKVDLFRFCVERYK